jgi:hypothetical protein
MSNTVMEKIVVEKVTQYGVRANGVNYGISPRLKDKGIEPNSFTVGQTYEIELYIGPKGGRSINSFSLVGGLTGTNSVSQVPAIPSLPPTTVTATKAPGGIPPVAPASSVKRQENDNDKKTDWAAKDKSIETQAILKSVLESPALAQMSVGKREEEVFQTGKRMFDFFLQVFKDAKVR